MLPHASIFLVMLLDNFELSKKFSEISFLTLYMVREWQQYVLHICSHRHLYFRKYVLKCDLPMNYLICTLLNSTSNGWKIYRNKK